MKVAVIGVGKTGGQVLSMLGEDQVIGPFSRSHPLTTSLQLKEAQVAIIFVPGEENLKLIPLLLEAQIPCVWGSTGHTWPASLSQQLQEKKLTWVWAKNFSLLINLLSPVLKILGQAQAYLPGLESMIHEAHHIHKKDAPSGTAVQWQEWLGQKVQITSERKDDIVGRHELYLNTPLEKLTLIHESKDRALFAQGAILSARLLLERQQELPFGLISFHQQLAHLGEQP